MLPTPSKKEDRIQQVPGKILAGFPSVNERGDASATVSHAHEADVGTPCFERISPARTCAFSKRYPR